MTAAPWIVRSVALRALRPLPFEVLPLDAASLFRFVYPAMHNWTLRDLVDFALACGFELDFNFADKVEEADR